jgi:hypothetical protein
MTTVPFKEKKIMKVVVRGLLVFSSDLLVINDLSGGIRLFLFFFYTKITFVPFGAVFLSY